MGGFLAALAPFAGPIGAIGGALIGARANKKAADKANELQDPVYMRERLEAAGLNPAVHYGSMASRQIAVAQPGSLVANGFAAAADILQTDKSLEIQRTRLEQENERLNREVTRLTLNPKVPGVYGHGRPNIQTVSDNGSDDNLGRDGSAELGKPTVTAPQDRGSETYVDTRVVDAEVNSARYGDALEEFSGFRNLWKDNAYNDKLQRIVKSHGRKIADKLHQAYTTRLDKTFDELVDEIVVSKKRPKARPDKTKETRSERNKRLAREHLQTKGFQFNIPGT